MRSDWTVSSKMPAEFRISKLQKKEIFSSLEWAPMLMAIGAETKFAWSPSRGIGLQLAIFHRFNLSIGYMGFPVAGERVDAMADEEVVSACRQIQRCAQLSLVRLVQSRRLAFGPALTSALPEASISNLQQWAPSSKKLKKDLAYGRRCSSHLNIVSACHQPAACHRLYLNTIASHGGKARYSCLYFNYLARLADTDSRIRFFVALDGEQATRGFSVVVRNGESGYYLHGAVDADCKKTGIGDLLVLHMIEGAREMGCKRLVMMASPWSQPGLHAFKMKWCDVQQLNCTSDYSSGFFGWLLRAGARFQSRQARSQALAWSSGK